MTFAIWGVIIEVKIGADFENDICNRISQRSGVVFFKVLMYMGSFFERFPFLPRESCWVLFQGLKSMLITKL